MLRINSEQILTYLFVIINQATHSRNISSKRAHYDLMTRVMWDYQLYQIDH